MMTAPVKKHYHADFDGLNFSTDGLNVSTDGLNFNTDGLNTDGLNFSTDVLDFSPDEQRCFLTAGLRLPTNFTTDTRMG